MADTNQDYYFFVSTRCIADVYFGLSGFNLVILSSLLLPPWPALVCTSECVGFNPFVSSLSLSLSFRRRVCLIRLT